MSSTRSPWPTRTRLSTSQPSDRIDGLNSAWAACDRIVTTTPDGPDELAVAALAEAGDLIDPIARGVLRREDIAGDLFALCRGETPGRRNGQEITLFKSVGSALEDLAAAGLAYAGEAADGEA